MKRTIWIGTAILVAAAAAVPLWLSLDDGSRNQAALAETTETKAINCDGARNAEACAELNRLLLDLDRQLAEINQRQQSVEKNQDAIQENAHYLAATKSELSQEDMLALQRLMEKKAQLEQMISNVMKAASEAQAGIAANLKG